MFRKILLPVDVSDKHGQAIDVAAELARQSSGEVVLLHVIEIVAGLPLEEEKGFYNRLEKAACKHLEKLSEPLKQRKIPCRAEVLYGNRGGEAVRYSRATGIDLIVLTAPAIDPDNLASGWGSLSHKISLVSSCPVLLVRTSRKSSKKKKRKQGLP